MAPALVVSFVFNPPRVSIVGPAQESTIAKLNILLPTLTSNSSQGRRKPETFQQFDAPCRHWVVEYRHLLCDEVSRMSFMLAVLDTLEDEGGWGMHDTHAITHDIEDEFTFFFTRKSR